MVCKSIVDNKVLKEHVKEQVDMADFTRQGVVCPKHGTTKCLCNTKPNVTIVEIEDVPF